MSFGFVKNPRLLDEKVSDTDYLDISSSISAFSERLSSTTDHLMIGVIGAFGVGKSTLISKTKESRVEDEEWIHFDAWQFPDRKELWEGLILDTAKHFSKLEGVKRLVDGQSGKDKKLATSTLESGVDIASTLVGLPLVLKPLFGLIKNLEYFADKSPARRVFEIQEIFTSLINASKKERIVFILEDVDRSGEAGLFFLETFRQFLNNTSLTKQVLVIVAISNTHYYNNIDSYLKCLDTVEFFNKRAKVDLTSFVKEVFESDVEFETEILSEFLSYLYNSYPEMNMRKIKLILRQSNLNYVELTKSGYAPNRLICIGATASRYISQNKDEGSLFDVFVKRRLISSGDAIARMILITNNSFRTYRNEHILTSDSKLGHTQPIRLVNRANPSDTQNYPSTPYSTNRIRNEGETNICVPDFYFRDL